MNNPQPDSTHGVNKPHGNGATYIILVLVGLAVGMIATVVLLNKLEERKEWPDHFPGAVMHMMGAHMGQLGDNIGANRCGATDTLPHLQAMRVIANDLEPAFPGLADDPRFVAHAGDLRATLDAALSSPPLDCEGLVVTASKIGENCKACHQDFR